MQGWIERTLMTDQIRVDRQGAVAIITINKPARRNALGEESVVGLRDALDDLVRDAECRAVVLTGAAPAFCSGSDLKELGLMSVPEMCAHEAKTAQVARRIGMLPLPVVAAVEGYALGGGMILALCCDVVVTARSARWDLPEVRNGWLPPWGLQALMARVGPVNARLLTWSITSVDGTEALRLGVADTMSEDGAALSRAVDLAEKLAALPAEAVQSTKRYFESYVTVDAERQDAEASRIFAQNAMGSASQATMSKFAGKA